MIPTLWNLAQRFKKIDYAINLKIWTVFDKLRTNTQARWVKNKSPVGSPSQIRKILLLVSVL